MRVETRIVTDGHWPDAVAELLHGLPEWFGIASSVLAYVEAARVLPGAAAVADDEVVGVCLIRRHTDVAAEIELLAVRRDLHRSGIGRALLGRVEADLSAEGLRLLQVKTFGPSGESSEYERTREFYRACGFWPLEERTDIWGPENPCLISVKPLSRSANRAADRGAPEWGVPS
jgi:GNAT superfamily N-acetyltransferase